MSKFSNFSRINLESGKIARQREALLKERRFINMIILENLIANKGYCYLERPKKTKIEFSFNKESLKVNTDDFFS